MSAIRRWSSSGAIRKAAGLCRGPRSTRYAPDVPLNGVADLAPASDTAALANRLEISKSAMLFAGLMLAG